MSHIAPDIIAAIRADYESDRTATVCDLARRYGIAVGTLYSILPAPDARRTVYQRERTISGELWQVMTAQHRQGRPWHAIAAEHNVSTSTIYNHMRRCAGEQNKPQAAQRQTPRQPLER